MTRLRILLVLSLLCPCLGATAFASPRAIIVVGLAAGETQSGRLQSHAKTLREGFLARGLTPSAITILGTSGERLRRDSVLAALTPPAPSAGQAADETWIVLLGTSATRGGEPSFQISGPRLTATDLTADPFLFMHGELPPVLTDAERSNLREYLLRGGFLFAEDCVIGQGNLGRSRFNDFFFRHMAEVEFSRIVPEAKLVRLPKDHPVFHTVFDFRNGIPHMQGTEHGLHALTLNGRVIALLSPSDIHCGWTNGDQWFGPGSALRAMQMGANIYTFAMTQT